MGMDYKWAGGSSYSRFNRELKEIAKLFGGKLYPSVSKNNGTINSNNIEKFIFPDDVNPILINWFNNPYRKLNVEDTKTLWENISKHPEIKNISNQLYEEIEYDVKYNEGWEIS